MLIEKSQIYTLSPISEWRVYKEGVSRENLRMYTSDVFDFDTWVQINGDDLDVVNTWLNENGNKITVGHLNPFYFTRGGITPARNLESEVYLNEGVLINMIPRTGEHVFSPNSHHFRDKYLLEHIDLMLFSQTIEDLEKIASKLGLPLHENVS